jgi:hypothetical protein
MQGKMAAVAAACLALGFLAGTLATRSPEVRAQEKDKQPQWEYKVVFSRPGSSRTDDEAAKGEKKLTDAYNALASDGWEYVGPVVDSTVTNGINTDAYAGISGAWVLFKRPKR